jgi:hypothetical protein
MALEARTSFDERLSALTLHVSVGHG